jgi:hypothetical protein
VAVAVATSEYYFENGKSFCCTCLDCSGRRWGRWAAAECCACFKLLCVEPGGLRCSGVAWSKERESTSEDIALLFFVLGFAQEVAALRTQLAQTSLPASSPESSVGDTASGLRLVPLFRYGGWTCIGRERIDFDGWLQG